jgi:integrase
VGSRLRAVLDMRATELAVNYPESAPAECYVFGNVLGGRVASIKTAWGATLRRAGIVGLHFHDLRREFGSRLLESGTAQHDVRDFLGTRT